MSSKPDGIIVQFGGQTPLNLAMPLKELGLPIIGTDPSNIDLAEDRKLFGKLLTISTFRRLRTAPQPASKKPVMLPRKLGFPVLVRPSYVLGGRAMVIAYNEDNGAPLHARSDQPIGETARADRPLS